MSKILAISIFALLLTGSVAKADALGALSSIVDDLTLGLDSIVGSAGAAVDGL